MVAVHDFDAAGSRARFSALLIARIAMGMGVAGINFPAIYTQARWIPLDERARSMAVNSGIPLEPCCVGRVADRRTPSAGRGSSTCSAVSASYGSQIGRCALRTTRAPRIDTAELDYIRAHIAAVERVPRRRSGVPAHWRCGPSSLHFCHNWSPYVPLTWLPTFVNKGLGVEFASVMYLRCSAHRLLIF